MNVKVKKSDVPNLILKLFKSRVLKKSIPVMFILILVISMPTYSPVAATGTSSYWFEVQSVDAGDLGLTGFSGLGYMPTTNTFFTLDGNSKSLAVFTMRGELRTSNLATVDVANPVNLTYNPLDFGIYTLGDSQSLNKLPMGYKDYGSLSYQQSYDYQIAVDTYANPQGLAFNSKNGNLYILDGDGPNIISIAPSGNLDSSTGAESINKLEAPFFENLSLKGLAINPENENYYVYSENNSYLYAVDENGSITSSLDLTDINIDQFSGMTFAPSSDSTDPASQMNLFVVDSGTTQTDSRVIELSLTEPVVIAAAQSVLPSTLVNIIDGSQWSPSNPDASGVEYLINENRLMISDSEVEEMSIYEGVNVFESTNTGSLVKTCDTTYFSVEPSGAAANPANGHRFFADDNKRKVFEVSQGPDGIYCTGDDIVTSISTLDFNDDDPEGVAYGNGRLFVTDGVGMEVNVISWGANGVFDGLPPAGDDTWTHFDTSVLGLRDPEGIGYHWERGTIFMISRTDPVIVETTITGSLLNVYDIDPFNIYSPAGVGIGPGSVDPSVMNVYVSDRGVDNNQDPNENDGKVYEVYLGEGGVTPTPTDTPTSTPTSTATSTPTATPTATPTGTPVPTPTPGTGAVYLSFEGGDDIGGVRAEDVDIIYFDGTNWSLYFDASDVGISTSGQDLNDFVIVDPNTILMTFKATINLGGVTVEPSDIVQFNATSTGDTTAGTFSMYFDGSDVGLDVTGEDLDSIDILPDGRVLVSVTSNIAVPGVSASDEDLLAFTPTSLGVNTSGTWELYFDGSDVGLNESTVEEIMGVDVHLNGSIYISTQGAFDVGTVSGTGADIFICTPISLGSVTDCNYSTTLFFTGSDYGITANEIDGLTIANQGSPSSSPTVTINQAPSQSDPTNASPINFEVVFSEDVTGFDGSDVTLSGTAGASTAVVTGSGTTYNVAVSGMTSDGTVIASIPADAAVNGNGNGNAASTSTDNSVIYDTSAPTVTINQAGGQADPTNTSPINFTVIFSEAVTGFDSSDVTLSGTAGGGTVAVTGSGTTYNVAVSGMTSDGTVVASVSAGGAQDAAGNFNDASASTDNSVVYDGTAPTVTINQAAGQVDPTNTSPINFTVVFSEAVTGFDISDVTLSGTAGASTKVLTGSGTTYNVAVGGMTSDGTVIAIVNAGSAQDAAGNFNVTSTSTDNSVNYITVGPTVTINQATSQLDPTNTSPINFTVVFNESVTGFDGNDITLSGTAGATTAVVTGSGTTYNVAVSGMTSDGTVVASIPANAAVNGSGNGNNASTSTDNSVIYDTTAPTVTINQAGGQADPTNSSPINFTVIFSEAVTGFDSTDLALSGTAGASTAVVTGSGTTYNVAVSGMTSDGTVVASVNSGGAQDGAGNVNAASTSTDNSVTYDTTAPTVTINQAAGQVDPTNTSPINFTVIFSEAVTGFETTDVTLSGTAGASTKVVTGSGTTYNVAVSGMTVSGTVVANVNAASAQDGAGNLNIASTSTDNSVDFTYEQLPSIIDTVASGEVSVAGTVSGDYLLTTQDGSGEQSITERVSGGKPNLRYSYLEHKWVFNLPQGNLVTLYAKAWSGGSNDQDHFDFAYSINDVDYFDMFSVVNTTPGEYVSFILPPGTQGTVYVRVKDTNRASGNLGLDTIYVDHLYIQSEVMAGSPPDAPTGLNAVDSSAYQIDLTWNDVATNELGYYIDRSEDNISWFLLDTLGAETSSYNDLTVVPDTTYYYRVRAYNVSGTSSYSNIANATTPTGLTLTGFGYKVKGVNTVELTWINSSATAFDIYRNGNLLTTVGDSQNPYIDEVGMKGRYSYQVCEANSQTICSNIVDIDL